MPDLAILDPQLLATLPVDWMAITALDALSHVLEGYVSKLSNPIAEGLVTQAALDIVTSLNCLALEGASEARCETLLRGSYFAGLIQNMMLVGPAHALAHQFGDVSVPHGLAVGLLMPPVIEKNATDFQIKQKYNDLALHIGLKDVDDLCRYIRSVPKMLGVPQSFSAWDIDLSLDLSRIAKMSLEDNLARYFPISLDESDMKEILGSVL